MRGGKEGRIMIRICDGRLSAEIDENGAELKSLCLDGTEFMRSDPADPWQETAPVLFPICGGLKDDYFLYRGKKYPLPKHGFAKKRIFSGKKTADNEAVFKLAPEEGDKEIYPWDYLFTVSFRLSEGSLLVNYTVENRDREDMLFSLGAHEGYALPEGLENYRVEFEKEETAPVYSVTGPLLDGGRKAFLTGEQSFVPRPEMFTPDALIFKDLRSRRLMLRGPARSVTVEFPGFPFLLLWQIPGSRYLCVEPWHGMPDALDGDHDLASREGIVRLSPGGVFELCHRITPALS